MKFARGFSFRGKVSRAILTKRIYFFPVSSGVCLAANEFHLRENRFLNRKRFRPLCSLGRRFSGFLISRSVSGSPLKQLLFIARQLYARQLWFNLVAAFTFARTGQKTPERSNKSRAIDPRNRFLLFSTRVFRPQLEEIN